MNYRIWTAVLVSLMLTSPLSINEATAQYIAGFEDERYIPLVSVDTHSISLGVYKKSYVDYLIRTGANDTEGNRERHLQSLIETYMIADHARKQGAKQQAGFEAFSQLQRKKALGGRFYELRVLDTIEALSDEEKRVAFAKYKTKVHVRHLYFPDEKKAEVYYQRLESGEEFVDLANEVFETAAYDSSAGDMGFITYFEVDDVLAEAAFNLRSRHEYTQPLHSRSGYHILRLENRITTPILTEAAYQAHGPGVSEDMQLRNVRLEGDAFVRSFMDSLNYFMNEPAIQALSRQIKEMVSSEPEAPPELFTGERPELSFVEAQEIQRMVSPETSLVTYQWDGVTRYFTAGDYFAWINDVPYTELKSNPAASIGRALRNEVFGLAGEKEGLASDPVVQEAILFEEQVYLAAKVKDVLRKDTTHKPTEEMVRSAFERLTRNRKESITVDYWWINASSLETARSIQKQIQEGVEEPTHYSTYQALAQVDVYSNPAWAAYLRQAPQHQIMVAGMEDEKWVVFEVKNRVETAYQFDDVRASLTAQLAPYAGEYFLLQQLYEDTAVEIDHVQFDQWPTR